MKNVDIRETPSGESISITIDLSKKTWNSKSGKADMIASTEGYVTYELPDGRQFWVSLNAGITREKG